MYTPLGDLLGSLFFLGIYGYLWYKWNKEDL
jgi:hypothetical protein